MIDLQTDECAALVGGRWRFAPTRVEEIDFVDVGPDLGPSGPPNRTYDVQPHAEGVDFDDSGWHHTTTFGCERSTLDFYASESAQTTEDVAVELAHAAPIPVWTSAAITNPVPPG